MQGFGIGDIKAGPGEMARAKRLDQIVRYTQPPRDVVGSGSSVGKCFDHNTRVIDFLAASGCE